MMIDCYLTLFGIVYEWFQNSSIAFFTSSSIEDLTAIEVLHVNALNALLRFFRFGFTEFNSERIETIS